MVWKVVTEVSATHAGHLAARVEYHILCYSFFRTKAWPAVLDRLGLPLCDAAILCHGSKEDSNSEHIGGASMQVVSGVGQTSVVSLGLSTKLPEKIGRPSRAAHVKSTSKLSQPVELVTSLLAILLSISIL